MGKKIVYIVRGLMSPTYYKRFDNKKQAVQAAEILAEHDWTGTVTVTQEKVVWHNEEMQTAFYAHVSGKDS